MKSSLNGICILLVIVLAVAGLLAQSPALNVERHGDSLHVLAPQLHFLAGKALDRLHDGSAVNYVVTLRVATKQNGKKEFLLQERFSVSYDLWEEKYSVMQSRPDGRSASRLTAAMVETWLLDAMPIPIRSIPEQQPFLISLECYADKSEIGNGDKNRPGLSLAGLIDVFSRKDNEKPLYWEAATRQLRLSDLSNKK
jgi:hypothetical protein